MNDEPSSSASASHRIPSSITDATQDAALSTTQVAARRKQNRSMFNRKRGDLLDDFLKQLDILVYAELSTVYYMDCSFLRLLLRCMVQFVMLTPKPAIFPDPPKNRPYVGAIFGTNLLCLIMHLLNDAPSAGEQTRGYMHGGLAMDFIGQKGPTSKVHLVILDLLVLFLQVTHLAVHIGRQRLKSNGKGATGTTGTTSETGSAAQPSTQTVDAEERGVRRSAEVQDIEMQDLNPAGGAVTNDIAPHESTSAEAETSGSSDRESLLASTNTAPPNDARIFDAFNSGQIVIADVDILKTIREQFWAYQNAEREPAISSARMLRANLASRVLGLRFAAGGRVPNV